MQESTSNSVSLLFLTPKAYYQSLITLLVTLLRPYLWSPETGHHEGQTDFSDNLTSVAKQAYKKSVFVARFIPEVYLGSRYHSCENHVDVTTPDKRLARGVPVLSREKSTPSMMKHLEIPCSENCLASGRAFKTRMIALEIVFNSKDFFNDLKCLVFDLYWVCSFIAIDIVILLRSSLFPSLAYTLVLVLPRRYLYLSVHC